MERALRSTTQRQGQLVGLCETQFLPQSSTLSRYKGLSIRGAKLHKSALYQSDGDVSASKMGLDTTRILRTMMLTDPPVTHVHLYIRWFRRPIYMGILDGGTADRNSALINPEGVTLEEVYSAVSSLNPDFGCSCRS
jgi:hypothetical protein